MYPSSKEVLLIKPMFCVLFYFQDVKKADTSLEDEWLSFEKMISDSDKPPGQTESSGSSQYLVHGMVAYPGMSLGSKQISAAPQVEDGKQTDGKLIQSSYIIYKLIQSSVIIFKLIQCSFIIINLRVHILYKLIQSLYILYILIQSSYIESC